MRIRVPFFVLLLMAGFSVVQRLEADGGSRGGQKSAADGALVESDGSPRHAAKRRGEDVAGFDVAVDVQPVAFAGPTGAR